MNLLDIFCAVFLVYFMLRGFFRVFLGGLFGLGGLVVAVFVGVTTYHPAGRLVHDLTGLNVKLASVVTFLVLFFLILMVFGFVGRMFSEAARKLNLSTVNRVLGVAFGGVKGVLITGLSLYGLEAVLKEVGRGAYLDHTLIAKPVMDLAMRGIAWLIPGGL